VHMPALTRLSVYAHRRSSLAIDTTLAAPPTPPSVPAPRVRANATAVVNQRHGLHRMWINVPHGPSARNLPNGHLLNGHGGGAGYLSSSKDEGRAPPT
jgi:hypothetical protein